MTDEDGPDAAAHIELDEISKHFGRVRALDRVSLQVPRGSIHALIGENGAGKSTLGKIVAGAYQPDVGRILLDGHPASFSSPRAALDHGIATIAQEPAIVPRLSVAENVLLGVEPATASFIKGRSLKEAYERIAAEVGFALAPNLSAGRLRVAEQQQVEILRALSRDARVIIMDEPSAALSRQESRKLHDVIRSLAARGKTIILISHFLREVLDLADSVTVLRDGRIVANMATADATEQTLVEAMLGRPLTAAFPPVHTPRPDAAVLLSVRNLHAPGVIDASLIVRAGEIVGLAGLVGAGRTELARAICGVERPNSGEAALADRAVGRSPRDSLRAGVVMIPESRKDDGLMMMRSVLENVTVARLGELSRAGVVRRGRERRAGGEVLTRCDVRGAGPGVPVRNLSGGNQQKVLFARSVMVSPKVLIADEPTRGVDIGAKRAIYDLLVSLAADGLGILLISSELEEIVGLAHRAYVMRRGKVVGELERDQLTERAILTAAFAEPATAPKGEPA
ncbi:MAG TPA: sugar ABC transporter ATP-binding protein [Solirubrobacteraceae bacterium]|jgi:simple sugar transport system ATP-binding protein/ribose transport system ATP-binding protein|nr:sugar ABC transporter ATP-binding protein [Solirubrobacteraceae bacterium]